MQAHTFEVLKDHPRLIRAVATVMKSGAAVFFSTNHQDFVLRPENLPIADIEEITPLTIPEDYVRKNRPPIHRC